MIAQRKALERHYAAETARLLGQHWVLGPDRESPDFVVDANGQLFGLEVTEIFSGPTDGRGAVMKRAESKRQKRIQRLQEEYEAEEAIPLVVQLVGDTGEINLSSVITEIRMLELAEKPPGHQARIEINEGDGLLEAYVTKALRSEWLCVDDRVGWVNLKPQQVIQQAIVEKAGRLQAYREASGPDVRLLVVANRIQNSGKLKLGAPIHLDLAGFSAVYFFSYPEDVHLFTASAPR